MQGQFARGGVNRAHRGHLGELGRSGAASLRVLEAGDFAHAGEGAAEVRDSDGTADNERDVEGVDDFVAVPTFFAAAEEMISDAIVAAKHGGGDKAEEFLGFGTERAGLVGLVVEGEEALDAEMGAGENFLVEVGAKFLEGVEVGHGSSSLIKARHYRKNCGRDAKARSDQREDARPSTRPGRAPVALLELQTSTPFAKTFSMPTGKANGLEKVERSMTVSGLKSTRSAKAPSRRMPRAESAVAGDHDPGLPVKSFDVAFDHGLADDSCFGVGGITFADQANEHFHG